MSVGHGLVLARDAGTRFGGAEPSVVVAFPRLQTSGAADPAGWGLDLELGAAWEGGGWSLGVTLSDAVSTFRWSRSALRFRAGRGRLGGPAEDDAGVDASVPRTLLDALDGAVPPPVLRLEAARRLTPRLEAALATRHRLRGGLDAGPAGSVGAAAAWRAAPAVVLQAGVAAGTDGTTWSVGGAAERGRVGAILTLRASGSALRGIDVGVTLTPAGGG